MIEQDMFPAPSIADILLKDQIACVQREIRMRERVYPSWVARGRMTERDADRELLSMRAVLATLETLR